MVEAACENRYQKLWVQSAYLQKNEDVTQAPAEGYNTNHETNARSALASPSSLPSISEKASGVNGENAAALVEASKKYGKQAKAMEHTYIAGQDVEKFDQSYQLAYDMGKNGVSFDYVENSATVSYLTDSQKRLAYEAGQAAAESSTTLNETGETVKVKTVAAFENGKMSFTLDNGEVVAADQLTLSDGEALLHNAISGMDISAQEANRLWQGYDGSISAEAYANGITEAYHYGRMGVAYGNIDFHAFAAALPEQVRKNAYEFGKRVLDTERAGGYNKAISEMEVQDDGTKEAVSHRGNVESPGRMGKENSGGEGSAREGVGRRIAEILRKKAFKSSKKSTPGRGRIETRETRENFERRTRSEGLVYAEAGSVAIGFQVAPEASWNENAKTAAAKLTRYGFDVVVFAGELQHNRKGITETSVDGTTVRSAGKLTIFISADLDIDGMETAYHEAFHAAGFGLMAKFHEKIADIIASNVDVESKAFELFVSKIADLYAYTESNVSARMFEAEIIEEFYAWYVGKAYATESGEMQVDMVQFSDTETIKKQIDIVFAQMEAESDRALPGLIDVDDANLQANTATEAETDGDASVEGKTIRKDTGAVIDVVDFATIDGGKVIMNVSDGTTVDAKNVAWENAGMAQVVETIASLGTSVEAANAMLADYRNMVAKTDPNISQRKVVQMANDFAQGIKNTFQQGKMGLPAEDLNADPFASKLTSEQRQKIYEEGAKAAEADYEGKQANVDTVYEQAKKTLRQNKKVAKKDYAVTTKGIDVENMDDTQSASFQMAERIAPAVKADIVVYDGGKEWGYYNSATDEIYLNANAKWNQTSMMAFTLAHELVHRAKVGTPIKFKAFADFLIHEYGKQGADIEAMIGEQMAAAKEAGIKLTPEQAYEEVICDACQKMLMDTDAGMKLAEFGAQSEQNRNFLAEFKKWLTELLEKLRDLFRNVEPDSLAAQEFARFDATTKQILADMFVDMSVDAGEKLSTIKEAGMLEKITTGEGGVKMKNSSTYDYSKSFADQVDDYKAGKIPKTDSLIVGATPEVFKKIGFNALPMTINTTHVDYALYGMKDVDHYLGETLLKQLPDKIKSPIAVFTSQTQTGTSVVALLSFKVNGKQIVAPIAVDGFGRQNGIRIDSNSVTSVFGKTNAVTKLLYDAMAEENNGKFSLLYMNKKEAVSLLQRAGLQLPSGLKHRDGFIHSIRESGSPVNMKFQDVTETQQFKRWFGDWMKHPDKASKVVNQDGTPKVVYHGSADMFDTFSYGHIGSASGVSFLGDGFYFTDKKKLAKNYGENVYECYLQMKKPYYAKETDAYKLNAKTLEKQGYDGVILNAPTGTIYMVFNNTQIKSATDNIGTFDGKNPNIRYKLPVESKTPTYQELVNKKPIEIISIDHNEAGLSYAEIKKQVLKNANDKKVFDKPHLNKDTGISIFLTPASYSHAFSNPTADFGADTLLAMDHITEIIHEAVLTHIAPPKNPRKAESRVFTFFAAVEGKNGIEPVKLTVKEYVGRKPSEIPKNIRRHFEENGEQETHNRLYDAEVLEVIAIEGTKKESGASASVANRKRLGAKGTPNSTIKIAELLDLVNGDAKKYVPQDATGERYKIPVESGEGKVIDTNVGPVYDVNGTNNSHDPIFLQYERGRDLVEFDHSLWKKRKVEAAKKYSLSDEEAEGLERYVGGEAYVWNAILLGAPGIERTEYVDYCITQAINGLRKFPQFVGRTYRNLAFADKTELDLFLMRHKTKDKIYIDSFLSSSKDPNGYVVPGDYIVHMVIDGINGRDISESFSIPGQQEVVFIPGTKLQFVSMKTANDGKPLIYVQEVIDNGEDLETDRNGDVQNFSKPNRKGQTGDARRTRDDLGRIRQDGGMDGNGNAQILRSINVSEEVKTKLPVAEDTSPRTLLANALESVAQNDIEKQKIAEYKAKVETIEAEEQKLHKLNAEIKELSFAKGPRDTAKIKALRDEATKIANRIGIYDKQLLRLEASKALQNVLNREKKKAYDKAKQRGPFRGNRL